MQIALPLDTQLARASKAAIWLQRKISDERIVEMLNEMSLTIEANTQSMLRHDASDIVEHEDKMPLTPAIIASEAASMRQAQMPIEGQAELPSITILTDNLHILLDTFTQQIMQRRILLFKTNVPTSHVTTFTVDLIRRRLQQLGWDQNVITMIPYDTEISR